jgi:polyhydroxybutyrate depolymerase
MKRRIKRYCFLGIVWSTILILSCVKVPEVELTQRDLEFQITHDGYERYFILHVPENLEEIENPSLIFALHGGGGKAVGMIQLTKGRFNELADRDGFLVVYPQGLEKSWNDGRNDPISFAHEEDIDDIGFFRKVIVKIINEYNVDSERVFFTGISNGGFMSIRVSRELADIVKGVAPVAASIPVDGEKFHHGAPPMNIMLINGTDDPLVPYNGGEVTVLKRKRGKVLSTGKTIKIFCERNGCSDAPDITEFEDSEPGDGACAIKYEYRNEETQRRVVLIEVKGGGHTWPGGWQYLGKRLIGSTCMDFNGCDEIWNYFDSL